MYMWQTSVLINRVRGWVGLIIKRLKGEVDDGQTLRIRTYAHFLPHIGDVRDSVLPHPLGFDACYQCQNACLPRQLLQALQVAACMHRNSRQEVL